MKPFFHPILLNSLVLCYQQPWASLRLLRSIWSFPWTPRTASMAMSTTFKQLMILPILEISTANVFVAIIVNVYTGARNSQLQSIDRCCHGFQVPFLLVPSLYGVTETFTREVMIINICKINEDLKCRKCHIVKISFALSVLVIL